MTRRLRSSLCALAIALGVLVPAAKAQDGALDATFNSADTGDPAYGANAWVHAVHRQSDGAVLIGGRFSQYDGAPVARLARLNAQGDRDVAFDVGSGPDGYVRALARQSDGRVLVGGEFVNFAGVARKYVARVLDSGALDLSFDPGSGANGHVLALAVQSDGKLLVAGAFTAFNGATHNRLVRLTPAGGIDPSFATGAGANGTVRALALQPDGRIVIGGDFNSYDGVLRGRVARLNTDGTLDTSFAPLIGASGVVRALALQPDGKLLIAGDVTSFDGVPARRVARLNVDGTRDASFDTSSGGNDSVLALALQPDGRVCVGGDFSHWAGLPRRGLARLNSDGTFDSSFSSGAGVVGGVDSLALQPDGRVVVGGVFSWFDGVLRGCVVRVDASGNVDMRFNRPWGVDGGVSALAPVEGDKTLIVGAFTHYQGVRRHGVVRVDSSGAVDPGFDPGAGAPLGLYAVAVQPDGKALVAGRFMSFGGASRINLVRLNKNGSVDATFDPGVSTDDAVRSVALTSNGRIVIAGDFQVFAGIFRNRVARLLPDGSLDPSFDPGAGADGSAMKVLVQPDGRVVLAGLFSSYGGVARQGLARLLPNGALDPSFIPALSFNSAERVVDVALQRDGKLVVAGQFNGAFGLRRLEVDGSLDAAYASPNVTGGPWTSLRALAQLPDDRMLIGGNFAQVSGLNMSNLARISISGALDLSFQPLSGPSADVIYVALAADGRAAISGLFDEYDGVPRSGLARIHAYTPTPFAYCTAGTSSSGCVPTIASAGAPSLSSSAGFTLSSSLLEGQRSGAFLYGVSGHTALPFGPASTSYLCVRSPVQRILTGTSGGTSGQCDGALSLDWLAFIAQNPAALGAPFAPGRVVNAQVWYRDPPAPRASNLSPALEFVTTP